jgi:hypothetical protein
MAALALVAGLLAVVLGGALRLEKASARGLEGLGTQRDLADQFRTDVARAADAPARWQEEAAGPTCLILRLGFEFEGTWTHRRPVTPGGGPAAVEFDRSGAGGRLVILRLFIILKDGSKQPSAEIAAALGGDLQ